MAKKKFHNSRVLEGTKEMVWVNEKLLGICLTRQGCHWLKTIARVWGVLYIPVRVR